MSRPKPAPSAKAAPMSLVRLDIAPTGIATATLNRPEVGNAYNEDLLNELIAGLTELASNTAIRALVLRGAGKHFQAGADIGWLEPGHAISARPQTTRPPWPPPGRCSS